MIGELRDIRTQLLIFAGVLLLFAVQAARGNRRAR